MLANTPIESLTERHLQDLVARQVSEKRTLEYKQALPSDTHESRREFLADVTSLANASGGHIFFGIEEDAGIPIAIPGLQLLDIDSEILRLENMIRDGVEPRLASVLIRAIPLDSGACVLAMRVPKSWYGPHVVKYSGHWRFYSRNSAGKYPLDTSELRQLYLQEGAVTERLRLFRDQRLSLIAAGETPVPLIAGARIIMHAMPLSTTMRPMEVSLETVSANPWKLEPIYNSMTGSRFNLDGFVIYGGDEEGLARGYVQIFRSGAIEALDSGMLRPGQEGPPSIPSVVFERELISVTSAILGMQQELGVAIPVCLMLSLIGVKGFIMAVRQGLDHWREQRYPIDRDVLLLPEVILEDLGMDASAALRPIFDSVWNACGWPRSFGYSTEGEWGKGPNMGS